MASDDSLKMNVYRVSGKAIDWPSEMELGYYSNEGTAQKVVGVFREMCGPEVPCFDVKYEKMYLEVRKSSKGYHIKNASEDTEALIQQTLTREELKRIANLEFQGNMEFQCQHAVKLNLDRCASVA